MDWYEGPTVLEALDLFEKEAAPVDQPLRFPVQDIYKIGMPIPEYFFQGTCKRNPDGLKPVNEFLAF